MPRFFLICLLGFGLGVPRLAEAGLVNAWVQYAAGGRVEVRAITDDAACPQAVIDGVARPMDERRAPDERFAVRICRTSLPAGVKSLAVEGQSLPVPVAEPRHLVVIGDSGCRLKGTLVQACNDPRSWPFRQLAEAAAAEHPDLVIHVGDYNYRENACPAGDSRCQGAAWGDTWPGWQADFFAPASLLLKSAVWVAERGNHEECRRSGAGWTAFLSPDPLTVACSPHDRPYVIDLGAAWRLAVVDDSDADDRAADTQLAARIRADLETVLAAKPGWLLTHHPLRGIFKREPGGQLLGANATLLEAFRDLDDSSLDLLLSGHIHVFQAETFAGRHPPQLVAGGGGDLLDREAPAAFAGRVAGQTVRRGQSLVDFGYLVMDRRADGWRIVLKGVNGRRLKTCRLRGRDLACDG